MVSRKISSRLLALGMAVCSTGVVACNGGASGASAAATDSYELQPVQPTIARGTRTFATDALIYGGAGNWATEVTALEDILVAHGATYRVVDSTGLNAMSEAEMSRYGAFVWPGGEGGTMAASLTTQTKANIRAAVQIDGVGYVGFCAGAFVAVAPTPAPGQDPDYGIGVVNGPDLQYYFLESQLTAAGKSDVAMTLETFADGSTRDLLWYGGPVVTSAPHTVIAQYPNGEAAISQMWSGNGWVILSAVHPSAPQSIRDEFGLTDSDGLDTDLAWTLVNAAIHQTALPTFGG